MKVLEKPNIIFGGINENFLHAKSTEQLFTHQQSIFDKNMLKVALETLHDELQPDHVLPDYSPKFRKTLAVGLFYKFVLSIKPENMNPQFRSGGTILERGLSSGRVISKKSVKNIFFLVRLFDKRFFLSREFISLHPRFCKFRLKSSDNHHEFILSKS